MNEAKVRTRAVELGGGAVVHVSRFEDPATGRDVVTLVKGWTDSSPLPPSSEGAVLELPGTAVADLLDALAELGD